MLLWAGSCEILVGRQRKIFSHIGDQESAISDPDNANQEKKPVACLPLDRMLFQLLTGSGSQAKKRKRLLAVWVKVSRLVIPYPV